MTFLRRLSPLQIPPQNTSPSLSNLLKTCKTLQNLQQIHAQIIQKGLEQHHILITQFICLCCNSFSNLPYATSVFNRVAEPNLYLWNCIIKGHCEKSSTFKTISIFKRMKEAKGGDSVPDRYTFPSLIKACSNEMALREGRMMHGMVMRYGTEGDGYVGTSLIDFYGKCREIECARKVFDEMSERNEVTWTAMIVGYLSFDELEGAQKLFDEMPKRIIGTWNVMLGGYVKLRDMKKARKMFDEMPKRDVVSFTTMIDGYAKAGDMASARYLFEQAPERDVVAWSALISGYVQNGLPNEAVNVFVEMQAQNVRLDEHIMVNLMSACSRVGSLQFAEWVDSYVSRSSIDVGRPHVVAALIDMNAKCGNMERASSLFENMPHRDLITYCSMIQGLSIHGRGVQAVQLFARMLEEGLIPDNVAFTVVFIACSRAALVEEGLHYFRMMIDEYSMVPSPDHYACMVDLLGRSGQIEAAYELIKSMPVKPHAGAWGALLGACKLHGNVKLGKIVADHLFEIEPQHAGNYVQLSSIYADANRWSDSSEVREKMRELGIRKLPGCSWV
ncbi:hypothetical protein ACHQM5_009013 [Ranunculus cassubicifolius]